MKDILFNKEAFDRMMEGFDATADAVTGTLGPNGRNVFIDDPIMPHVTNDGHTIANAITFPDKFKNMGSWVVRNSSAQTNDDAGDGTTTTAVLLQEIVHESLKRPENPMAIKVSLQNAAKAIVERIKSISTPITGDDAKKVALISAENEELATLVSDIVAKVGTKGVVMVEDSRTFETSSEVMEGYEANAGFMSPHFATDNGKATFENTAVFVAQKKIATVMDIKPLFDQIQAKGLSQLVIVCEDIDPQILGILVVNKLQGKLNIVVIKASGAELEDIAATVGASIVSDSTGITFESLDILKHFGKADKVVSGERKTLFVANTEAGKAHAERIKALADNNSNLIERERIMKRVAKLTGGIGIIRIGAATTLDRVYKMHKVEDAVAAVKSALEEGVVEGGGMALWRIAAEMQPKTVGEEILKKALTKPLRKIIENCGKDYTEIIIAMPQGQGYDAKNDCYTDMIASGIIDPAKVERVALENAVSNAALFITAHAVIVDAKPEI